MASRASKQLVGPLHPVTLKHVAYRTLCKHAGHPTTSKELIRGVFLPDKNLILVDSKLPDAEREHIVMHELVHAAEYQLSGQDEEGRVDGLARWIAVLRERGIYV